MLEMSWHQGVLEIKQFVRARESLVFIAIMPAGLMLLFGAIFDFDVGAQVSMRSYYVSGM